MHTLGRAFFFLESRVHISLNFWGVGGNSDGSYGNRSGPGYGDRERGEKS